RHLVWPRPGPRQPLAMLFRDHTLSDLIGFVYSHWRAADAAADFVARIKATPHPAGPDAPPPLVSVILDGENAWEYYANDGKDFLDALYARLTSDPDIACVT